MIYEFLQDKDGHKAGELLDIAPTDWREWYYLKKRIVRPYFREQDVRPETPERPAQKNRKRKR